MPKPTKKLLILQCYHLGNIKRRASKRALTGFASPALLRLTIRLLHLLGYQFTTVVDALSQPFGNFACLTFDDGYSDVFDTGFPLLRALNIPATVYLIPRDVGKKLAILPVGKSQLPGSQGASTEMLSWAQARQLAEAGWEIGSRGYQRVHLTHLPERKQRLVIKRANELIRRELGTPPLSFSYPYGAYDALTIKILREEGFKAAVTLQKGLNVGTVNPFQLHRVPLYGNALRDYWRLVRVLVGLGQQRGHGALAASGPFEVQHFPVAR